MSTVKSPDAELDHKNDISRSTSIFDSPSFTFIIGQDGRKFVLPGSLVASSSKVLSQMVNGSMKEAVEHHVILTDVDNDTFVRYCEFIYTGRYHDPKLTGKDADKVHNDKQASSNSSTTSAKAASLIVTLSDKKESKKNLDDQAMQHNFENLHIGPKQPKLRLLLNEEACADIVELLTAHINVYIMADKYDISDLSIIAWKKIHRILVDDMVPKCIDEKAIVSLIDIIYSQTAERPPETPEPLRKLIASFASLRLHSLLKSLDFRQLANSYTAAYLDILNEVTLVP